MNIVALALILLIIIAVLIAIGWRCAITTYDGGADGYTHHIVVDTLNLIHWMYTTSGNVTKITLDVVDKVIRETLPVLREAFDGRIMYVIKDKEGADNDLTTHRRFMQIAQENRCYIVVTEKQQDRVKRGHGHTSLGRDDFMSIVLARRWKCAILTGDKMRDFDQYRTKLDPFHVFTFSFWKDTVDREYVNPESHEFFGLKRPRIISIDTYFPHESVEESDSMPSSLAS